MTYDVEHFFSYAYLPGICLFGEICVKIFGSFLLVSFQCSLYILDNSPLPDASFANMFSPSVALILLTLSPVEQMFLISVTFSFSIFFLGLMLYLKSHHSIQGYLGFLLLFSMSFIVLYFIFRSIIHSYFS